MNQYQHNLGLLFSELVNKHKTNTAIFYDNNTKLTYYELDALSNRLARWLLDHGYKRGQVIGIFNTKKPISFALMIAALKLGVIYVNLDITSPTERLKKIIGKCKPLNIFYDSSGEKAKNLVDTATDILSEEFTEALSKYSDAFCEEVKDVASDNPAYIMFTSGSTGFPKGAVMTHQNLINFIGWSKQTYQLTQKDILSNANPMYFDNSVFDFYSALFTGATLAPIDAETVKHPGSLTKKIDDIKATVWFSVPSLLVFLLTMRALSDDVFKHLRIISFGGEGFPKSKLKQLYDIYSHRIRIVNVYGPTECTCICSSYDICDSDFQDMKSLAPLGFIAPNFDYIIMNDEGNESKEGELWLAGPQVGLGYYNDPERTKNSFVQHPKVSSYSKVVYKTGDLVKLDKDGMLHIKGRTDNQIKYMGYRIELEEIEAGFSTLKYVDEVAVIHEIIADGLSQIKAFLQLNDTIDKESIKEDISGILAPYMVPKKIIIIESMPKNQNGKTDKQLLRTLK